ncbi:MAG: hypothetical protein WCH99_21220 [Verrucomicrobiota bacterium]
MDKEQAFSNSLKHLTAEESLIQQLCPKPDSAPTGVTRRLTLEDVLRIMQSRSARLPKGNTPQDQLRYYTAKNGVFFYPACGFDWEPIRRFSGVCDTFIYCDYAFGLKKVVAELEQLPSAIRIKSAAIIPQDFVQAMTHDSQLPPGRRAQIEPWGFHLSLTCHATKTPKQLHLLYLAVEGVTLYANLFTRHAHPFLKRVWAPEYLCIKNNGRFGNEWTDFLIWENPLGQEVARNEKKPKFVVTDRLYGGSYNWPWNQLWMTFRTWPEEFPAPVYVYRRPEITPTPRENQNFRLPGVPEQEWPLFNDSLSDNVAVSSPKKHPNPFRRRDPSKKPGLLAPPKTSWFINPAIKPKDK